MKRLVTLVLALAFTLGMAAQASALEVNVKGNFHFSFNWMDNVSMGDLQNNEAETFIARQRIRLQVEFVASENLKGVLFLHSNDMFWGQSDDVKGGAALDTNQKSLNVRFAYIDWNVADTSLNVKMGLQNVINPNFVAGATVIHDAMAGITLSNKFNDNVTATLGWYRPSNNNGTNVNNIKDAVDMFMATVPLTFDGVKITPWGEYTFIGRDARLGDRINNGMFLNGTTFAKKAGMYHAGISASVDVTDAFNISGDFVYGGVHAGDKGGVKSYETDGFYAALKAAYDMGNGKLAGTVWYASGNDADDVKKHDYNTMPSLIGTDSGDPGLAVTSMGFWGNHPLAAGGYFSQNGVGTWGVVLGWEDFSFLNDLTHTARLAFYQGTHDKDLRGSDGRWVSSTAVNGSGNAWMYKNNIMLTEKDNVFELNFDSKYQIAKGFTATMTAGYAFIDWQSKYEDAYDLDDKMWRVGIGFQYAF